MAIKKAEKLLKPSETEVEAYEFIRQRLRDLGWIVKDPSKGAGGQVWTQNQCLGDAHIKNSFGKVRPENVVKLSERSLWIIEAKQNRKDLAKALQEATDFYGDKINSSPGQYKAILATGVAGNEASGYLMRTAVRVDGKWRTVTINKKEATGLLSPDDVRVLLQDGGADVHEFAPPQWLFISAAERINEILHAGGINKEQRARTMAALLLSVIDEPPNLETSLQVLIGEINARSEAELSSNGKPEFAPFVRILVPTNNTNHAKFKNALVRTILELQNLNIRSAMNSSTDVLGQFYEVFLKYGNGAKEIGIVLTPRHVTRFAVEAIGVGPTDIVLDPACGTGGFLVAAFDYVRRNSTKSQLDRFKKYNLFGIEQESYVAVLAIVNMIFRGDGKHNITEGNCFSTYMSAKSVNGHSSARFSKTLPATNSAPVTRVLMNPPFALRDSEKEYRFVSRALDLMSDGGILFALLPLDALFGSREEKVWRRDELLKKHTLLSVVTLPDELFYPTALKQVAGVIIKKGVAHPVEQDVFWGRIAEDGLLKIKSKRLPGVEMRPPRSVPDDIPKLLPSLRSFVAHPGSVAVNEPMLCKTTPIDYDDPLLELVPEAYIESKPVTKADIEKAADDLVRETASFLIRFRKESIADKLDADN
ncbi:type I restriction enzyme M protein [Bradyrhizobium sp. GM2.4]